jgi:hypothetical protein
MIPNQKKSKLQPHGDGPFHILDRINDKTYKINLPSEYSDNAIFNVDLTSFDIGFDSRLNPFKESGDGVDKPINTSKDPLHIPNGSMTQSKMNVLVLKVSTNSDLKGLLEY